MLKQNPEVDEIAVLKENVEFAIIKQQQNLNDIFLHTVGEETAPQKKTISERAPR